MTSLVDVIFLLLLFFMLSSTFSTFAEIELVSADAASGSADARPLFVQLGPDRISLNGDDMSLKTLAATLQERTGDVVSSDGTVPLLVSLKGGVDAQRLADLLVVLRGVPDVSATVLGSGP